ncbi:glycosyltransferase family 32 protein [Pedobacter frigiditerrae]|uniref:glycosyltransferase family 32 protein n=1 Tax=Pedobacter frigiditerrae TaxID=2530452 RepID=UPI00292FB759|nr:glycosyltransferase [Pedobacter frigiditerrae]
MEGTNTHDKIPKIIHYCWFSGEELPIFLKDCIDSWKRVMPDYKIRLWDANSFDFDTVPFVKEAFSVKKWAFVADYIRLYALYTEGGIYFDSDVMVFKPFDEFLRYDFFTSHEIHPGNFTNAERNKLDKSGRPIAKDDYVFGLNVQAAIMGGTKGNPYIKECMEFYHDKHFLDAEGKSLSVQFIIGPYMSKIAENYGYLYHEKEQMLDNNMKIFKPEIFVGNSVFLTKESYAIHLCNGSWKEKTNYEKFQYNVRNQYPSFYPFITFFDKVKRKMGELF